MSWSFRRSRAMHRRKADSVGAAAARRMRCSRRRLLAATVYVQPTAALTAEERFQSGSRAGLKQWIQGYMADARRSFRHCHPEFGHDHQARAWIYRDYPKDRRTIGWRNISDFRSDYSTQRSSHAAISGTIRASR